MRAVLALLLACAATLPARAVARRGVQMGVASSLEKLRPGDPVPRGRAIELSAAHGECESAQIGVRARGGLEGLAAETAPLRGPSSPGVRGAFAEVRIAERVWRGPEADPAATLRAWRQHFEERGWADRPRLYTLVDEPGAEQIPELRRRARLARAAGIRVFATVVPSAALADVVDDFAPNLALVPDEDPRPAQITWSYASCLSHGCAEMPESGRGRAAMRTEFAAWPGYEIDRPGTAARAVPLLGVRRGLTGELYYDMLHAWTRDPWSDVRAFAGNGDGTLLYPGRPASLGGTRPFPVESIRLKIVRDALEDGGAPPRAPRADGPPVGAAAGAVARGAPRPGRGHRAARAEGGTVREGSP